MDDKQLLTRVTSKITTHESLGITVEQMHRLEFKQAILLQEVLVTSLTQFSAVNISSREKFSEFLDLCFKNTIKSTSKLCVHFTFFFFLNLFTYLFMAVLGLCFCARALSSCGKRGPLFIAVRGPPTAAASLVAEHRLQTRRLSNCGSRAQLLRGMWDLPRPGPERVSPALAGRLSTTAPPGKPPILHIFKGPVDINFILEKNPTVE